MQKTKTILLISFLLLFISIDVLNAFELTPGKGALEASRKILCSTIDDKPIVYWWYGRMYSRVQGESDKLLFRVEGMNIRACKSVKDSKRGNGFKMVSRELLFYQDPQTGEILKSGRTLGQMKQSQFSMWPTTQSTGVVFLRLIEMENPMKII